MTGLELKEIRESLGLTQSQLAKELNVDRITISRWEMGHSDISRKYEANVKMINGITQQVEAQFVLLLDKFGALTTKDFITTALTLTDEEIKKYAKEGMIKIIK
ncbi:MAG: helix-turn-helix domain-containing protein [Candidatus Marinimicrobia bacterium]|nr:helix-turn-helix domain-containing protein [Candidatus Neomarinimicrobiota bacterium]